MSSLSTNVTNLWPDQWSLWPPESVTPFCHGLEATSVILKALSNVPSSFIQKIGLYASGAVMGAAQNYFCQIKETGYGLNEFALDATRLSTSSALKYFKQSNSLIFLFDSVLSLLQYSQRNSFYHTTALNQKTYDLVLADATTELAENFKQGAELNVPFRQNHGLTPLELAVLLDQKKAAQTILDAGPSISSQYNAIKKAISCGHSDLLIQLIEYVKNNSTAEARESVSTLVEDTIKGALLYGSLETVLSFLMTSFKNQPIKDNQYSLKHKNIKQAVLLINYTLKENPTLITSEKLSQLIEEAIFRGLKSSPKNTLDLLRVILENKQININQPHVLYEAIEQAILFEEKEILSLLIGHVLTVDPIAKTILSLRVHQIIEQGLQIPSEKALSQLKLLLENNQIDVNQKDAGGQTPLLKLASFINFYALFKDELHLYPEKVLITEQFSHESRVKKDQERAMRAIAIAIKNSMNFLEKTLKLLLQHQADPRIPDRWGNTALHWAAINQLPATICKQLIQSDADKYVLNQAGWSYNQIKAAIDGYKEKLENYNPANGRYRQSNLVNSFFEMKDDLIRNNIELYPANKVSDFKSALLKKVKKDFEDEQQWHLDEMNRILKQFEELNKK